MIRPLVTIKSTHQAIFALTVLAIISPMTIAQEDSKLTIILSTDFGVSDIDFPAKLDQKLTYHVLTPGITFAYGDLYLTGKHGFSLSDADVSEEEEIGSADREDTDITVGYRINKHLSIFTGFHSGKSEIKFVPRDPEDNSDATAFTDSYEEEGIHVGTSYSFSLGEAGALSASVAYAKLDADNTFNQNIDDVTEGDATQLDDVGGRVSGDSTGFSYGVRWTMSLTKKVFYAASFKVNDFKQDISIGGREFEADETITHFTMGLNWVL